MNPTPYKLSYIGASLAVRESVVIAETFLALGDWRKTEEKVKGENLIQTRTQSSLYRYYFELAPRLQGLTEEQLTLLVEGTVQEQKYLLWYAICKHYAFIREFAVEVLHEKYLVFDFALTEFDYERFFNRKADWHEELAQLKDSSRVKMRTMLFRMLRDGGLVNQAHVILPALLSRRLVEALQGDAPWSAPSGGFEIFPVSLAEITA